MEKVERHWAYKTWKLPGFRIHCSDLISGLRGFKFTWVQSELIVPFHHWFCNGSMLGATHRWESSPGVALQRFCTDVVYISVLHANLLEPNPRHRKTCSALTTFLWHTYWSSVCTALGPKALHLRSYSDLSVWSVANGRQTERERKREQGHLGHSWFACSVSEVLLNVLNKSGVL